MSSDIVREAGGRGSVSVDAQLGERHAELVPPR